MAVGLATEGLLAALAGELGGCPMPMPTGEGTAAAASEEGGEMACTASAKRIKLSTASSCIADFL